jgi:hypothetical protein
MRKDNELCNNERKSLEIKRSAWQHDFPIVTWRLNLTLQFNRRRKEQVSPKDKYSAPIRLTEIVEELLSTWERQNENYIFLHVAILKKEPVSLSHTLWHLDCALSQ